MEHITIEKVTTVTPKILTAINSLLPQLKASAKPLKIETLIKLISQQTTYLFVAKNAAGEIVGMVTLAICIIPFAKKAFLEDIVVDQGSRGKGVGKKLVLHALSLAKEQEVSYVDLTSNPKRTDANAFYQRLGFEKRDTNAYRISI